MITESFINFIHVCGKSKGRRGKILKLQSVVSSDPWAKRGREGLSERKGKRFSRVRKGVKTGDGKKACRVRRESEGVGK